MAIYYVDLWRTGHNNPRFAIISVVRPCLGGRAGGASEQAAERRSSARGGGLRAAYNKHFMHGVRARGPEVT